MNQKAQFTGFASAVAVDKTNEFITLIDFVFTDFKPNKNKHAIPASEADNIIRSGVHMPIKIHFEDGKPWGHYFTTPIGSITSLSLVEDRIIGTAALWNAEYDDIITYIQGQFSANKPVNFSWELAYSDISVDSSQVAWLSGCTVLGSAIVETPAYAGRTPLLAVAEEYATEIARLNGRIEALENQLVANRSTIGMADNVEDKEPEVAAADTEAQVPEAEAADVVAPPAVEDADPNAALLAELEQLRQFKADHEAQVARAALEQQRRADLQGLMSDDQFARHAEFIFGLSDSQFSEYCASVKSLVPASTDNTPSNPTASASTNSQIPDPITRVENPKEISIKELAAALKSLNKTR